MFKQIFYREGLRGLGRSHRFGTGLSHWDIDQFLQASENFIHLTFLSTLCIAGLRVAELLAVRLPEVHWGPNQLLVWEGKGRKNRVVMLIQQLKTLLQEYLEAYQPKECLFNGQEGIRPYSPRSAQPVVRANNRRAGIHRKVSGFAKILRESLFVMENPSGPEKIKLKL